MPSKPPFSRVAPETEGEAALWRAVGDLQDEATETRAILLRPEQIAEAVEQGLMRAVSNPEFWTRATNAMQAHAARQAGGWLIGSIGAAMKKAVMVAVVVFGIYSVGGWSALAKAWAMLRGSP